METKTNLIRHIIILGKVKPIDIAVAYGIKENEAHMKLETLQRQGLAKKEAGYYMIYTGLDLNKWI